MKIDKCFFTDLQIQFVQGSNLCPSGEIGKMSNWNPIYRSYSNGCSTVHVNYIVQSSKIKSVLKLSEEILAKEGNPLDPLSADGDAHRGKWGFGKGSRQLIGFATQEYLQITQMFTENIYR